MKMRDKKGGDILQKADTPPRTDGGEKKGTKHVGIFGIFWEKANIRWPFYGYGI